MKKIETDELIDSINYLRKLRSQVDYDSKELRYLETALTILETKLNKRLPK